MTTKPLSHSNKATGWENNDALDAIVYAVDRIHSGTKETLPESLNEVSREWLESRHVEDTARIEELTDKLKTSEKRGDDFCYKMLAAERKQIQAEVLAANRLTEIKKLDAELAKYAKLEEYLFQTMQVAQDQRQKYLDGLEDE